MYKQENVILKRIWAFISPFIAYIFMCLLHECSLFFFRLSEIAKHFQGKFVFPTLSCSSIHCPHVSFKTTFSGNNVWHSFLKLYPFTLIKHGKSETTFFRVLKGYYWGRSDRIFPFYSFTHHVASVVSAFGCIEPNTSGWTASGSRSLEIASR